MKQLGKFTKKEQDRAFQLRQELLKLRASATENFFRIGIILKEVRDKELWRMGADTFEEFFADPEIGLKRSTAYHAIKLVETFPKWERLVEVPVSKLIMIAPHVTEDNKEELLKEAEALSRSDLGYKLREEGKIQPRDFGIPKIYRCKDCKLIKGVKWDDLCHCGWSPRQIEYVSKLVDSVDLGGDVGGEVTYEEDDY